MSRTWIGLGSNLQDPAAQLQRAFGELDELADSRLLARSRLYRSRPMGPAGQPDYLNAVALLETALEPLGLLDELQHIEERHGRVRGQRWGPRTLDLDLLLYDERLLDLPQLKVPHPGIAERDFVLLPMLEIDPDLQVPGQGRVDRLLAQCAVRTARPIDE